MTATRSIPSASVFIAFLNRFPRLVAAGLLVVGTGTARAQDQASYGELAGELLCGGLEEIVVGLTNLNDGTLPHEAKALRKELGRFRNRLDLFAFAYPTGPGKDKFLKLREDVDKGYERMGNFKDLFDTQRIDLAEYDPGKDKWSKGVRPEALVYPDPARVSDRRKKVLKWRDKFVEPEQLAAYQAYICAPDLKQFHERLAKDLSRFYWGGDEGIMPRGDLSGIDNFRALAAELLDRSIVSYPAVLELRHLEGEVAVQFHDFRKRARSVVKIADDIDILPKKSAKADDLHELMDDIDDGYGDVNDIIVDLELAVESGNEAKAAKLRAEIATEWETLREWQTKNRVEQQMTEYAALLRSLIRPRP